MDKPTMRTSLMEGEIPYHRPEDVPHDLPSMERAIIAARNVRAWADFLLQSGPSSEHTEPLKDSGPSKGAS